MDLDRVQVRRCMCACFFVTNFFIFLLFYKLSCSWFVRRQQAISAATYTYLILLILAATSISSFLVSMFYKPLDKEFIVYQNVRDLKTQSELRIITSFFNDKPIASLLDLFEWLTSFRAKHCTCVYALHLTELNARCESNLIGHHKGKDQIDTTEMDPIHNHLVTFAQVITFRICE